MCVKKKKNTPAASPYIVCLRLGEIIGEKKTKEALNKKELTRQKKRNAIRGKNWR